MPHKPLLASEVMRDEAAPLEPARGAARLWLLGAAAALALSALVLRLNVSTSSLVSALVLASVTMTRPADIPRLGR